MKETDYIGKYLNVVIDRPLGSCHPTYHYEYPINYGYIPDTLSGDNEELDAYIIDVDTPLTSFTGKCIAVIERLDDNENKLIIVPDGVCPTDEEIYKAVEFQEKYFKIRIIR